VTWTRRLFWLAAFVVPAIVYVASASPEPASWDTAELQGVPYILGISHPTGFPFYVLVGYVWSHLFAFGSVAWRLNAMSGVAIAVAAAAAYGVALEFGASAPIALLATLWFAFSQNIWSHAVRAEAQDLAVACEAVAIYAVLRWMRAGSNGWYAAAFALCGLGMAAHPNALWVLPALIVAGLVARRRPTWRLAAGSLALLIAGLALYLYLPLRSAYIVAHRLDPAGVLAGAGGGIFWNYNDPHTLHGFIAELTGSETETAGYLLASLNPVHIDAAIWAFIVGLHSQFGTFAMLLLAVGLVVAWRRDWRATLVIVLACTMGLLFSVVYPNESDVGRYRLLASWLAVPLFGALTPRCNRAGDLLLHVALMFFLAVNTWHAFQSQRGFLHHEPGEGGRWVIGAVQPHVSPGSVIVSDWLDATSLAYGAYVDGSLPGRIVISDDRLRIDLYQRWAEQRPVYVLVDPHDIRALPGGRDFATLDAYHELYQVVP
jgi:4-amino-4-deoxy-L-arabinose transferase-like glycosyltransferase